MLWANWGHFYATRAFSRSVIFICFQKKQSILMLRRHKQNHRAPTFHNHCFEQSQKIQFFSTHIWAWRHAGAWGSRTLKTPKKVDPLGGPDYSTANSKSKLPKYIG